MPIPMPERRASPSKAFLVATLLLASVLAPATRADEPAELAAAYELYTARRDAEAKAAYESILARNSRADQALYYLARLAKRQRDWETVAARMEEAVKIAPNVAVYWADLGEAYGSMARSAGPLNQLGLARKTRDALRKAAALDPSDMAVRAGLIQFYREAPWIAGGGMEKAIDEAESVKKVDAFRGAILLGALYQQAERWSLAETQFREAMRLNPSSDEPRFALGQLYAATSRFDEAASMFEDILQSNPDNYGSLYQVGRISALSGRRLERGEDALRRYLASPVRAAGLPSHAHAWHRLGNVLERKGDISGAREAYRKSVELDSRIKEAADSLASLRG